mgnify:CR=1 FL=1
MKMIVSQRRKDKDIGHLPENHDKSKLREDRRKQDGIDKKDPDLKDTKRDPDLRISGIAGRIASGNTSSFRKCVNDILDGLNDVGGCDEIKNMRWTLGKVNAREKTAEFSGLLHLDKIDLMDEYYELDGF